MLLSQELFNLQQTFDEQSYIISEPRNPNRPTVRDYILLESN